MADGKVTISMEGDNAKLIAAVDQAINKMNALEQTSRQTGETGQKASDASVDGVNALASALAAAGITASLKSIADALYGCYEQSKQFNTGMSQVYTLVPGITDEMATETADSLVSLKNEYGIMGNVATKAMYDTVSATGDLKTSLSDLEIGQKAAVGGATDLITAMDGLTSVTNAYGKDVVSTQHASDLMFTAVRQGKTTFNELSASLYNVIPIASASDIAFGDVTAALAHMTSQGTPTAVATTKLNQMFVELTDNGTDVADAFKTVSGQSFKEFVRAGGNTQEALVLLNIAAENTGVGINELFGSTEAGSAALALSGKNAAGYASKLEGMADAAGATNAAFSVMAETAAYSSERFNSSIETMQISIGNVLESALVDLQDVGTGAFLWASEFVEENPWLVQAIAATVAGLGVAAAGVTVLTVSATLAAPAFTAMSAALTANPIGMFAVGVTSASAALGSLIVLIGDTNEELTVAKTFADDAAMSLEKVAQSANESAKGADTQAGAASVLISRLAALEKQGVSTTKAQQEYTDIIAQLAKLYPNLNLQVDENTGLLNRNAQALQEDVEYLKQQAKADAYYTARTEAVEKLVEAEIELENNSSRYNELLAERKGIEDELAEINEKLSDTSGYTPEEIKQFTSDQQELSYQLSLTHAEFVDQQNIVAEYQDAVDAASEAVNTASTKYDEYNAEIAEQSDLNAKATESFDAVIEKQEEISNQLETLKENYQKAEEAALNNINSVVSGFAYLEESTATSVSTIESNLQSQIDYMDSYATNYALVMEKAGGAMPEQFVSQLSDGSVESAEILAGLATATDEEMQDIIAKMGSVSEGKEEFAKQMAETQTNFSKEMEAIEKKMAETVKEVNQAEAAAQNTDYTIDAIIQTVHARTSEVEAAYQALANAASKAYQTGIDSHSPSKVFAKLTDYTVDAINIQTKEGESGVKSSYLSLAQSAITGYDAGMKAMASFANAGRYLNSGVASSGASAAVANSYTSNADNSSVISPTIVFSGDVNDPDVVAQKVIDIFTYDLAGAR